MKSRPNEDCLAAFDNDFPPPTMIMILLFLFEFLSDLDFDPDDVSGPINKDFNEIYVKEIHFPN
jgi:hypothetical protein